MQPETVLAIDFGLRRMGLAVGQSITGTASPIDSIAARDGVPDWAELDRLVAEWRPHCLVVGLPLNMDGTESEMSGRTRRFATLLKRRYSKPVDLTDERLTTREAMHAQPGTDKHAAAARLIAETWLGDRVRNNR
ncbi:MAG: Holliday junction resolvase RuvX [Gammaproteobacteria bacterium]|nr:Holliday junction resolvase RuvX [Gammaproteobacteria bacterium]